MKRINVHAFQASTNHINKCDGVKYLLYVLNIDQVQTEQDKFEVKMYRLATNRARRWGILFLKEALYLKEKYLTFNNSLKVSK